MLRQEFDHWSVDPCTLGGSSPCQSLRHRREDLLVLQATLYTSFSKVCSFNWTELLLVRCIFIILTQYITIIRDIDHTHSCQIKFKVTIHSVHEHYAHVFNANETIESFGFFQ